MSSCYSWTMPSTAETEEMVPAWSRTRKAHGDHTVQNREEQKHLLENAVEVVYDDDRFAMVEALCV